ncbi:DUF3243 domain-containing protein [Metallumcola ferriviriculae]|uniref:DUF3243 domain-containing protein n=1 Tax=Metallumcola ferriviriculae TaxID=3039180 RepID=A0AAU0USX4_9FIRM|nr:DUF3243 domain-containing protein [Desulfitibacteraceae bacterium MK1]
MPDQLNQMLGQLDASSWESWKKSLGNMVKQAEQLGISNNMMEEFAAEFGDFLAANINPDVPENKSVKELWEAANESEQKVLSHLMIKLSKQ